MLAINILPLKRHGQGSQNGKRKHPRDGDR
jgi:hypothetical protein